MEKLAKLEKLIRPHDGNLPVTRLKREDQRAWVLADEHFNLEVIPEVHAFIDEIRA